MPHKHLNEMRIAKSFEHLYKAKEILIRDSLNLSDIREALSHSQEATVLLRALEQNLVNKGEPVVG